jgi:protein gp37
MGDKTGIEWTESTWNPLAGCSHVGPECENCYAARESAGRFQNHPLYKGLTFAGKFNGNIRLAPDRLTQPLSWGRGRRIFVNSMSDLFHPRVPTEYIAEVFAVMVLARRHQFQVLTKRPTRMARLLASDSFQDMVDGCRPQRSPLSLMPDWPASNIWLGVSIGINGSVWRADKLRQAPAAIRFISAEPLLEALPDLNLNGIDWLIAGGESGLNARPMHPDWARDLRDRCQAQGVAFHFKQHGEYLSALVEDDPTFGGGRAFNHPLGGRQSASVRLPGGPFRAGEWQPMRPGDVTVGGIHMLDECTVAVRVGKKKAGRVLDGRTWDNYPGVPA